MIINDKYKLICGMETHAELKTNSKMFCGCKNDPFAAPKPNIYTCPVCLGMPGGLPVPNKTAIEWTIKLGLALGCKINLFSKFDRKNYFYPDLSKGYQISQYDIPFCYDGVLETSEGPVRIRRIHLEEDTGKLMHTEIDGTKVSLVDFNRSGVPLIEIVTKPDIHTPQQAKEYGRKLRQILRYLEISDADMEQGGMRLEANISISPLSADKLPDYKVEVKNINSFRFVEQAIAFEASRHANLLENGEVPDQETRGWNPTKGATFAQRTKEEAEDYRYFPDPDIPPIRFTDEQVEAIRETLPELPEDKVSRWHQEFGVEQRYGQMLILNPVKANWLDSVFKEASLSSIEPNKIANALVNKRLKVVAGTTAQEVIAAYSNQHATDSVDETELLEIVAKVIEQNQDAVEKYRAGETKIIGFFMGQVMKELGKKADANQVRQAIKTALAK